MITTTIHNYASHIFINDGLFAIWMMVKHDANLNQPSTLLDEQLTYIRNHNKQYPSQATGWLTIISDDEQLSSH